MLAKIRNRVTSKLRYRLLLLVLFPLVVVIPAILCLAIYWAEQFNYDQLLRKVNTDLSVAHNAFVHLQRDYLESLKNLARTHVFQSALAQRDQGTLQDQLRVLRLTDGFDFIHVTGLQGQWIASSNGITDGTSKASPLLERAAQYGSAGVGVEIYSADEIKRENPVLASRIVLKLHDTPYAAPSNKSVEDRALVVRAVYPVRDVSGVTVALLDGGVLLNRNFSFVDAIRDLVYSPGSVARGGWGAVTVFLQDVRISTNVPYSENEGERALGTRVSGAVRNKVLGAGEKWIDRAFEVNDWYISGYEPIVDVYKQRVGMLYAGFVETPFRSALFQAITILSLLLVLASVMGTILAIRGAKSIFQPIEAMTAVVRAEQNGKRMRIGAVQSHDEIGELAVQFDRMLDLLEQRNREIQQAAEQLEIKVDERTFELREKNARLQQTIDLLRQTRKQLVMAEKLAALGELTAGVAHEINNPTAVILGNVEIVISELGKDIAPVKTELDLIIQQVYRIRTIVEKLLKYSRPAEYVSDLEQVALNEVIDDTLLLVRHEADNKDILILPPGKGHYQVLINRQELQQVLVNLIINAIHASSRGAKIKLSMRHWASRGVIIRIRDYGRGIPAEQIDRIFDPFYTSDKAMGTGLGLSVSYGLIRHYGGRITVQSEPGVGTIFEIYLLKEPVFTNDDEMLIEQLFSISSEA